MRWQRVLAATIWFRLLASPAIADCDTAAADRPRGTAATYDVARVTPGMGIAKEPGPDMAERDLYGVLGVKRDASQAEIRKAFRRRARQHHPDVNPGNPQATEKFKEVSAANDVLSDEKKRKAYDEFGEAALRSGFDPEQERQYRQQAHAAPPPWGGAPGGGGDGGQRPGGFDFDLGDLFGGGTRTRRGPVPGDDLIAHVDLDLATALRGTELSVDAPTAGPCATCHGAGKQDGRCARCEGTGRIAVGGEGPMRIAAACPQCGGRGQPPCPACHGEGLEAGTHPVTVRIPPGADHGARLRVPGLGRPGRGGGPPGDLYIEIRLRSHRHFRREGLHLYLTLPVSVDEAYNGASVDVPTPTGVVALKVPPRSQSGQRLRVRGHGVQRGAEVGDLYCELEVRLPDRDDPAFAAAVRATAGLYAHPLREGIAL
jgi:molecular chaperone DnaJ